MNSIADRLRAHALRPWQWISAVGIILLVGFALGLGSLAAFAWLADEVLDKETEPIDFAVLAALKSWESPFLDGVATWASAVGSELVMLLLFILVAAFALQRRWLVAIELIVVTVGAQELNNILKELFHRTRPAPLVSHIPAQAFSFPSGHAMVSAAFYFFVGWLVASRMRGPWRYVVSGAFLLVIVAIGLSRLYIGVHYFTDVIAGYLAGFLWADAVIIADYFLRRRSVRRQLPKETGITKEPPVSAPGSAS